MLYAVVGIIVLLAVAVIYSTWMRKKVYSQIDRLESWKNDLMTRPVAEEMARMKELKMIGEAEKKFDEWRSDWDDIVAARLPAIEKELFEVEEQADKYRFNKAFQGLKQLEDALSQVENQIGGLLKDLNEVVESEHKNRKDIIAVKEDYHQIKKSLITKRSQFKGTFPYLEEARKSIDEQFKAYDSETDQGNYIKARKILLEVRQQIDTLKQEIEQIPKLYKDIHHTIPDQLKELRQGYHEMVEQKYVLQQLQVEEQIDEMEKQLNVLEQAVERLELDDAAESIQAMHDQLDWLYAQMEKEVLSRKQLHEVAPAIEQNLEAVGKIVRELDEESEMVQESYHINVEDLKAHREIDKAYRKLEKDFFEVDEVMQERTEAFSIILEKLETMKTEISAVEASAGEFKDKMKALRKDELTAKETLQKLKKKLFESRRLVRKSNLPGVPRSFVDILEDAEEHLSEVSRLLDKKPLDMSAVQQALDETVAKIDNAHDQTKKMIDTAVLAEELIQYGNRYRSDYADIDRELTHAEQHFRNYDYEAAVETAVQAIERKEPKILKRMGVYADRT